MKTILKKITFIIILIIITVIAFFGGGVAYKYNYYKKIPVATYLHSLFAKPHFYPAPHQDKNPIFEAREVNYPYSFIVYGDSRELAFYEKTAILSQVVSAKPSFVIHLGDMVYCGDPHQWENFDFSDGKIITGGIPFFPVLGNHEYRNKKKFYPPDPEKQLQYYFDRFKFLKNKRWYSFTFGNSVFLILDTNTDYSPGSEQYTWLKEALEKNSSRFLFIALHHPPYTKRYHNHRYAEKRLAHLFETGPVKPDIVFSGHQHNYERYNVKDIQYIVSGGGGTEQHSIEREPEDLYNKPGETFHYCKITISEATIHFEMVKLAPNTGGWQIADTFTLSKPAP